MPLVVATRAKLGPNLLSLSRIRYFGACPYGVASRSCCATQASVGDRVTPTWITFRDFSSMMKKAKSGRKNRSVTCKKSHAQICAAWLRRKVAHVWPRGWCVRTASHVLLNGALADTKAQFQQFTPNPFSTPESIVLRHLPDQGDGFCGDLGLVRRGLGLALPIQAKELPMPAQQGVWLHDEEGLLPGSNQPGQQDEEDAIGLGERWPFHLPLEDDELLSQEGIFRDEL